MSRVLGIDPGSRVTGYGIIDTKNDEPQFIACGCLRLKTAPLPERLADIYECVSDLIKSYSISTLGIEDVFVSKNARSALVLGHARGSAIVAAIQAKVSVHEFTPRQIKLAITGTGSATKNQVGYMVKTLLHLKEMPPEDAADALAVALTTASSLSSLITPSDHSRRE